MASSAAAPTLPDVVSSVAIASDIEQPSEPSASADVTTGAAPSEAVVTEPYYWEEGAPADVPPLKIVTHNLHWIGWQIFHGIEYMGEVFAEFLGMTASRYDWAIEAARQEQEETEERELQEEQRQRWAMIDRLNRQEAAARICSTGAATDAVESKGGAQESDASSSITTNGISAVDAAPSAAAPRVADTTAPPGANPDQDSVAGAAGASQKDEAVAV